MSNIIHQGIDFFTNRIVKALPSVGAEGYYFPNPNRGAEFSYSEAGIEDVIHFNFDLANSELSQRDSGVPIGRILISSINQGLIKLNIMLRNIEKIKATLPFWLDGQEPLDIKAFRNKIITNIKISRQLLGLAGNMALLTSLGVAAPEYFKEANDHFKGNQENELPFQVGSSFTYSSYKTPELVWHNPENL